ncbi:WD40 repeat domain-containing protein [Spirillospora sp. CA-108201]
MPHDHDDRVLAVALSSDGRFGATSSRSGEVRVWQLGPGAYLAGSLVAAMIRPHDVPVRDLLFLPGEHRLVTSREGVVQVGGGETLMWTETDPVPGEALRLTEGGPVTFSVFRGDIGWRALSSGAHGWLRGGQDEFEAVEIARDGVIVGADVDGRVHGWARLDPDPVEYHRPYWTYTEREPFAQRLLRVCDRGRLVVSPRRGRVVVLDARDGEQVAAFAVPARPTAIAVREDEPLVVIGDREGVLSWWDARTGGPLGRVQAHRDRIQALAVTASGLVMTGSRDGTAALWRMSDQAPLARFEPAPDLRRKVPYGREDPWELSVVDGSPDGRLWLVGGHGGQVHALEWSGGRLTALRIGTPGRMDPPTDLDGLLDDLRDHRGDPRPALAAARALIANAYEPLVLTGLIDLVIHGRTPEVREEAVLALVEANEDAAVTTLYRMFAAHGTDPGGIAGRLLGRLADLSENSAATELVESLAGCGNLLGVLLGEALAERGAAAFPAVHAALRSANERAAEQEPREAVAGYHLAYALRRMGEIAAPAVPALLEALEEDDDQNTRHGAKIALRAIGRPAVDALVTEILRRAAEPDPEEWYYGALLDVLRGTPPPLLAASSRLGEALEAVRRHGDGHERALAEHVVEWCAEGGEP